MRFGVVDSIVVDMSETVRVVEFGIIVLLLLNLEFACLWSWRSYVEVYELWRFVEIFVFARTLLWFY